MFEGVRRFTRIAAMALPIAAVSLDAVKAEDIHPDMSASATGDVVPAEETAARDRVLRREIERSNPGLYKFKPSDLPSVQIPETEGDITVVPPRELPEEMPPPKTTYKI